MVNIEGLRWGKSFILRPQRFGSIGHAVFKPLLKFKLNPHLIKKIQIKKILGRFLKINVL